MPRAAWEPPADVVRHDGDDPYLVVAATGHTATFSDIANALARIRLLLDDAFASGRSTGTTTEDGHHCPRRLGTVSAISASSAKTSRPRRSPLPASAHVGRRVRQRHAAVGHIKLIRRLRPPPHLNRSDANPATTGRAQSACSTAALVVGWTMTVAVSAGRAASMTAPPSRHAFRRGARGVGHRRRLADADRLMRAICTAPATCSIRRHRHLREGVEREPSTRADRANDSAARRRPHSYACGVGPARRQSRSDATRRVEAALAESRSTPRARQFGRRRHSDHEVNSRSRPARRSPAVC